MIDSRSSLHLPETQRRVAGYAGPVYRAFRAVACWRWVSGAAHEPLASAVVLLPVATFWCFAARR